MSIGRSYIVWVGVWKERFLLFLIRSPILTGNRVLIFLFCIWTAVRNMYVSDFPNHFARHSISSGHQSVTRICLFGSMDLQTCYGSNTALGNADKHYS